MSLLEIRAGAQALKHIQKNGLSAADISAVFGASGSAKWLAIYGLDVAIFDAFLKQARDPIALYGTSIGAFKLAAAARQDPAAALRRLADMYIEQTYEGEITPEAIAEQTSKIIGEILTDQAIDDVLSHPIYRFHCGAIRCHGRMASANVRDQKIAMIQSFVLSLLGRDRQKSVFSRSVFHDPRSAGFLPGNDGFGTLQIPLSSDNFRLALTASGSLPVYMHGIQGIPGDSTHGVHRDGGLLDYHPVPSSLSSHYDKLVLYPHFYPHLKEGWFDKLLPWRKVPPARLREVILLAPGRKFVEALPHQRIPDRQDFYRYARDSSKRQQYWRDAMARSEELGREFLKIAESGEIARVVRPFDT